jgi:hypothetical protein
MYPKIFDLSICHFVLKAEVIFQLKKFVKNDCFCKYSFNLNTKSDFALQIKTNGANYSINALLKQHQHI